MLAGTRSSRAAGVAARTATARLGGAGRPRANADEARAGIFPSEAASRARGNASALHDFYPTGFKRPSKVPHFFLPGPPGVCSLALRQLFRTCAETCCRCDLRAAGMTFSVSWASPGLQPHGLVPDEW